ncbi:MAG: hypothetical protein EOO89_26090 [Pedobacter sp.]|nr:MAG: hypothetical protein EOO89_26090 [Pedobacter sp.]
MSTVRSILSKLLRSAGLVPASTYDAQQKELNDWRKLMWKPGHYYSPYHDLNGLGDNPQANKDELQSIDLNETAQLALLEELSGYYNSIEFPVTKQENRRYYFHNDYFSYSDGIFLHSLMRYLKPKRILEIGSGYSSAMMLDTNEHYLNNEVKLSFVEPYPEERLLKLIRPADNSTVLKQFIQQVVVE